MKYCMDCKHYIPGGGDHNCSAAARGKNPGRFVSALKEACGDFEDRSEKPAVEVSNEPRKPRRRRRY